MIIRVSVAALVTIQSTRRMATGVDVVIVSYACVVRFFSLGLAVALSLSPLSLLHLIFPSHSGFFLRVCRLCDSIFSRMSLQLLYFSFVFFSSSSLSLSYSRFSISSSFYFSFFPPSFSRPVSSFVSLLPPPSSSLSTRCFRPHSLRP